MKAKLKKIIYCLILLSFLVYPSFSQQDSLQDAQDEILPQAENAPEDRLPQGSPGQVVPQDDQTVLLPPVEAADSQAQDAYAAQEPETSPSKSKLFIEEAPAGTKDNKISLDLRGIEITELFKVLSQRSGTNIVTSSQVRGRINIFLKNVTIEEAIDIILISQNLASERKGGILYVMTAREYQETFGKKYYEKRKFKIFKLTYASPKSVFNVFSQIKTDVGKIVVDESSGTVIVVEIPEALNKMEVALSKMDQPLPTETFSLNYAQAENIQSEISRVLTPGSSSMQVDKRTNKIIVTDLPEKIELVKDIMHNFDEPTKQVFIEAEIIQVLLNDDTKTGISWEKVFTDLSEHGLAFSGDWVGELSSNTGVGKWSIGTVDGDGYNVLMRFIQTIANTNVLSRPRIAVLNNEEASILIGTREAYTTGTLSQGDTSVVTSESVEFIDVGVKLKVVPTISNDGYITMRVRPEVSVVKDYLVTPTLKSRIPIVETSETETVVKVKDGSMIMIGGLIKKDKIQKNVGVPGLAKIPGLNLLFSSNVTTYTKTELVIFLRPRIITGDVPHLAEAVPGDEAILQRPLKGFISSVRDGNE